MRKQVTPNGQRRCWLAAFRSVRDIDIVVIDDVDILEDTPFQVPTR